ncbi:MAG: protease modulator HflC [Alphaproteobacteria bacterium]
MNKFLLAILLVVALGLIALSQSLFIVDQREQAIVLQLGQPIGTTDDPSSFIKGPGLHFKLPVIQSVRYFDSRILSVDPQPEQVVISSDSFTRAALGVDENEDDISFIGNESGEPIIVDSFARYKIVDPLQFLKTLRDINGANSRIQSILNDATRTVLGKTTLETLLSDSRNAVMADIKNRVNRKIEQDQLGIELVDVRIVRADLTAELRTSTVRRMISELKERATETRAKGEERALEIRSTAEKERTVLIAEAERDAQMLRGQGDNEAIKIYADAFNQDKEFYGFIRSMEAYSTTLSDPDTKLILSPTSDFFRYFQDRSGQ